MIAASARRVWGMMYRHLALYRRSWPRLLELSFFPMVQLMIWGFTARFFAQQPLRGQVGGSLLTMGGILLGGALLWEVALRSQMGLAITFLEEVWSRNLGHVFVSPLRPAEMLTAMIGMSVIRTFLGVAPAALLAYALYHFNLLAVGPVLALFLLNLMMMGWWVALGVVSLILKHGAGAEALAWSVVYGLAPFSAIFYPVAVLPHWVQPVAWALPSSHVFEGLRSAIGGGVIRWDHLGAALALNLLWLAAATLLFVRQFQQARRTGALLSIGE